MEATGERGPPWAAAGAWSASEDVLDMAACPAVPGLAERGDADVALIPTPTAQQQELTDVFADAIDAGAGNRTIHDMIISGAGTGRRAARRAS
jgi:hypothetical protein